MLHLHPRALGFIGCKLFDVTKQQRFCLGFHQSSSGRAQLGECWFLQECSTSAMQPLYSVFECKRAELTSLFSRCLPWAQSSTRFRGFCREISPSDHTCMSTGWAAGAPEGGGDSGVYLTLQNIRGHI